MQPLEEDQNEQKENVDDSADDIVSQIEAETGSVDTYKEKAQQLTSEEPLFVETGEHHWYDFLKHKKFWLWLVGVLFITFIFVWLIQPSRLFIVNMLGIRTDFNVSSLVAGNQQGVILRKVKITINGADYKTDDHGRLFVRLPYGNTHVVASKTGYETSTKDVMLDFDPFFYLLGGRQQDMSSRDIQFQLKNVGLNLSFTAKDWLSGQPLTAGEFTVGDVVAVPDENGLVLFALPPIDADTAKVSAKFGGAYVDRQFDLPIDTSKPMQITFVPAGKDYFISKRSGQYVVYGMNLDGGDKIEVVPGNAQETSDIAFSASPSGRYGVLTSTREGKNSGGMLVQKLYIVDLSSKALTVADEAKSFSLYDWSGDRIVYVARDVTGGQRLASLDVQTGKRIDLAKPNDIADVRISLDSVAYMSHLADASQELHLVPIGGGVDKSLGAKIQKLSQSDYDRLTYQTADQQWHEYNLNNKQLKNVAAPVSGDRLFLAVGSADKQTRLLVDRIDGKLTVASKGIANGQEKQLHTSNSLQAVRWAGNTVLFRLVDGSQSADYAISLAGGHAKKLTDVSARSNSNNSYIAN
jgi:hypothetical protein